MKHLIFVMALLTATLLGCQEVEQIKPTTIPFKVQPIAVLLPTTVKPVKPAPPGDPKRLIEAINRELGVSSLGRTPNYNCGNSFDALKVNISGGMRVIEWEADNTGFGRLRLQSDTNSCIQPSLSIWKGNTEAAKTTITFIRHYGGDTLFYGKFAGAWGSGSSPASITIISYVPPKATQTALTSFLQTYPVLNDSWIPQGARDLAGATITLPNQKSYKVWFGFSNGCKGENHTLGIRWHLMENGRLIEEDYFNLMPDSDPSKVSKLKIVKGTKVLYEGSVFMRSDSQIGTYVLTL